MLFFGMGWIFFVKKLFKDYELRHHMVQLIFCINFTLSCTMFELIIFEVIDHMERSSRYFHWILALYAMLFMIILLTPFYIFYNVLSNIRRIPAHWLTPLCFVSWIIYIVVFWKIGDPFPIHNPKVQYIGTLLRDPKFYLTLVILPTCRTFAQTYDFLTISAWRTVG